jgi:SAM-dependent methyltransferase
MTFDSLAAKYDTTFTETKTARWLRGRVHARLNQHFKPGARVLELGCGTGEDARHLAAQGVHVTATDASRAMLEIAASKNKHTPLATFALLDINQLPAAGFDQPYDGVFASFGVLNCTADWQGIAAWLAKRVVPGGRVMFGIMSPYSLWEIGWHGAHGKFGTATRRLRGSVRFEAGADDSIRIHYPAPRRIRRDFAPHFEAKHLEGLAIALPTSEAYAAVEKRARLHRALLFLDERLSGIQMLAPLADHYWIELQRRAE